MREIKFRLIKDGKIVGYEKWYPGERHSPEYGMEGWAANPRWLYSFDNKAWGIIYIEHDSKDSSTGLKNRTGKDIYEGDMNSDAYVVWSTDGAWCLKVIRGGRVYTPYNWNNFLIIGNIHEPELLEKNNGR